MVLFNSTAYACLHNLQSDVVALLDSAGAAVVKYRYDAWGMPISKTGDLASTLGTIQPFRYRGYVYDEETGLYYLRSRYYNANWSRFISIDGIMGHTGGIGLHNLYTYCLNLPIMFADHYGYSSTDAATNFGAAKAYRNNRNVNINCLAYAFGMDYKQDIIVPDGNYDVSHVASIFVRELESEGYNIRSIEDYNSPIEDDEYRIAFRTSESDYHFMVQHKDGSWSHKPGFLPSRKIDGENPSEVSWDQYEGSHLWGIIFYEKVLQENWYNSETLYFAVTKNKE